MVSEGGKTYGLGLSCRSSTSSSTGECGVHNELGV